MRAVIIEKLFLLCIFMLLSGCWLPTNNDYSLPTHQYEIWKKDGKSTLQVKVDMLECGFTTVDLEDNDIYRKIGISNHDDVMNYYYTVSFCMENLGYRNVKRRAKNIAEVCSIMEKSSRPKKYAVCQPGFMAPAPTEKRRLSGYYCAMNKETYNTCLSRPSSWCDGLAFPLECYSNSQYKTYLETNIPAYMPINSSSSVQDKANSSRVNQLNDRLELELLQNNTRQQTNKEMNNMLKHSFPK